MPARHVCGIVVCAASLLVSCAGEPGLPPGEVLDRAAQASRHLRSARFTAHADVTVPSGASAPLTIILTAAGRLQDGGQELQFSLTADGRTEGGASWHLEGDTIVAGEREVYANVHTFSLDPPHPLLQPLLLQQFTDIWWRLPHEPAAATGVPIQVTPDPRLLRMQTEIVDVMRDHGRVRFGGRTTYHYDVALNRERFIRFLSEVARERGETQDQEAWKQWLEGLNASGELWIDAEDFILRGVQWKLLSADSARPFSATLRVELSDLNSAEPIAPPSDVRPFPGNPMGAFPNLLMGTVPGLPPPAALPDTRDVPPDS